MGPYHTAPGIRKRKYGREAVLCLGALDLTKLISIFKKSFVFCALVAQINSDSLHRGIFSQCLTKSLAALTRFNYHIHALSYTLVENVFGEQGQARALPFIYICKHRSTRTERRGMVPS